MTASRWRYSRCWQGGWYVQAPPRSVDAYCERVVRTADGLRSQLENASGAASDFGELDPPVVLLRDRQDSLCDRSRLG